LTTGTPHTSRRPGAEGKVATYFGKHHGGIKVGWFEEETPTDADSLEKELRKRFKREHGERPRFNER
jgi:hypothetical protein